MRILIYSLLLCCSVSTSTTIQSVHTPSYGSPQQNWEMLLVSRICLVSRVLVYISGLGISILLQVYDNGWIKTHLLTKRLTGLQVLRRTQYIQFGWHRHTIIIR
ncbi:uncharacterized protein BCR38DRAFT_181983 [Pseudomassariella vexata]|uniref:Secreted protein n=1 Tax=Pseudomassariella vexata TaxID=1141098 RepID=A0A1Y2E4M7_9PEZI|nr:uncharacterized protein BCR38DRAFT_181983 [Pseudomassariella vexata]ORY66508.1 hypothetical protein BCR38DRAFT_181983 [Pseudomassariella vexata]